MRNVVDQKFRRGDVVHIAKDLGSYMSHFDNDQDAVVMYSYAEKYGGSDVDSWCLLFCETGGEVSWYHTHQLTFLRHGGQEEIDRIKNAKDVREAKETDLAWIVSNWKTIRNKVPGPTMGELMRRVGITNPWGSRGEGITWYCNAMATMELLDPILSAQTLEEIEALFARVPKAEDSK
jgi:hypothetical protein